jgi:hypothetical protein
MGFDRAEGRPGLTASESELPFKFFSRLRPMIQAG